MALIRCPECKSVMSSQLDACPKCGYKLSPAEKTAALDEAANNPINRGEDLNQAPRQPVYVDEGSFAGGFCLGFFLGLIGLIIGLVINKPKLKKGAIIGFVVEVSIGIVFGILYGVLIATGVLAASMRY